MNRFCQRFDLETPILNAGMGLGIAGPELAAAVSEAGGCGVLGLGGLPPDLARESIRALRERTRRNFGVNQLLPLQQDGAIDACFEERVPLMILFWGDPAPYVADAKRAGVTLFSQVGDADEASRAADAGVDGVVIQGREAGGHVKARDPIEKTLAETVAAVPTLPVIASGGIRDGADIARVLLGGASAVSIGTRYLATYEAKVVEGYKKKILEARASDTVLTELFGNGWPDAPHRVLRNRAYEDWQRAGEAAIGKRPGEGRIIGHAEMAGGAFDLARFTVNPPVLGVSADLEELPLYAGESCECVDEIVDASTVTQRLRAEYEIAVKS